MTLVVDAGVAAKWFIQEPDSADALAIRRAGAVIAPDLVVSEVMNAAWKNVRGGRMSLEHVRNIAAALPMAFAQLVASGDVAALALEAAVSLDHPTYDAFYIATAEYMGTELVTADVRLFRKTRRTRYSKRVRLL